MIPHGGFTLLLHYGSLFNMLKSLHPSIQWHESKFLNMDNWWNSREHRRMLMDIIGQQLSIHQVLCFFCRVHIHLFLFLQPSDWYSVTKIAIETQNKKAKRLWRIYSSLEEVLRDLYPEYPWDPLQFALSTRTSNRLRQAQDVLLQLIIKAEQQLGIQQVNYKCFLSKVFLPHSFLFPTFCFSPQIGIPSHLQT